MALRALKKNRIFQFFASLKLAVILLVSLGVILATATFYESAYDTKTAQYLVYQSPFFALFLATLGLNLTCSAMIRYPWKKSQTGFVITHLGIIIILAGSLLTMAKGVDGSVSLEENESTDRVMIDQPVLYFGTDLKTLKEIPAEYRWNRPQPGQKEYRYSLAENSQIEAVIDHYYHHAKSEVVYEPSPTGSPAVKIRLHNDKVDQEIWLTPALGQMNLGPAKLSFNRLADAKAEKEFVAGTSSESKGTIQLLIDEQPEVVNLDLLEIGKPCPLELNGVTLELVRYLPYAVVENNKLVSKSLEPRNPAVEVILRRGESSQSWLLFALLPELSSRTKSSGPQFSANLLYQRDEDPGQRSLDLALKNDGTLYYRLDGKGAKTWNKGQEVATGWMDLKAELLEFYPRAKREKKFTEVFPKKGKEDKAPGPAIRIRLEGKSKVGPIWLERGDIQKVFDAKGKEVFLGYGYRTVKLPFELTLKDFRVGFDPGTQTAATYESDVTVKDKTFKIAMNEPLQLDGFKVFQASFSKSASGTDISVFSVAKDPGIELKYLGSILLVLGIIIMFYFKPKKSTTKQDLID